MKENQNSRILVLLHERIFILRVTLYKLLRKNSISCSLIDKHRLPCGDFIADEWEYHCAQF